MTHSLWEKIKSVNYESMSRETEFSNLEFSQGLHPAIFTFYSITVKLPEVLRTAHRQL